MRLIKSRVFDSRSISVSHDSRVTRRTKPCSTEWTDSLKKYKLEFSEAGVINTAPHLLAQVPKDLWTYPRPLNLAAFPSTFKRSERRAIPQNSWSPSRPVSAVKPTPCLAKPWNIRPLQSSLTDDWRKLLVTKLQCNAAPVPGAGWQSARHGAATFTWSDAAIACETFPLPALLASQAHIYPLGQRWINNFHISRIITPADNLGPVDDDNWLPTLFNRIASLRC